MTVTLSEETQRLIQRRMTESGVTSADRLVRLALETLDGVDAGYIEDLDPATQAAIEQATEEIERGEGRPWDEVRAELTKRYLGK